MNPAVATNVYDHAGSMARMGNDLELFREMCLYLDRDGQRWLGELKTAQAAGDVAKVQQRAHSLKGLISNFGVGRAWQAAAAIEDFARARRVEELAAGVSVLDAAFAELRTALAPHLADHRPHAAAE